MTNVYMYIQLFIVYTCTSNHPLYKHVHVIHCTNMYMYIHTSAVHPIIYCQCTYTSTVHTCTYTIILQSSIVDKCTCIHVYVHCTSNHPLDKHVHSNVHLLYFIAYQTVQCSSIRPCNCILLHLIVHSSHLSTSCR